MGCGMGMIKYLLFIFNFIFAVCGLAILTLGVMVHLKIGDVEDKLDTNLSFPAITLIVVGSIIFVISFFGCCGAIRESHCMTITFASFLLFILLVQVAVAVFVFVNLRKGNDEIVEGYKKYFEAYQNDNEAKKLVDYIQNTLKCCGVKSSEDFPKHGWAVPGSCCDTPENNTCSKNVHMDGCVTVIKDVIKLGGTILGSVAIAVAGVELVGIVFALCLANSIRNSERRGYRV